MKDCSLTVAIYNGYMKRREAENTRVNKNRSRREKNLTNETTSMKKWKKMYRKYRDTEEQKR